jgi:hypothetical protein
VTPLYLLKLLTSLFDQDDTVPAFLFNKKKKSRYLSVHSYLVYFGYHYDGKSNHLFSSSSGETSADWDKAWSAFKKKGKRTLFSDFSPDKYVTWNPRRSEYPLSEEVDPIKRTERSNLMLWTSPQFTLVGAIIIVLTLLIYTLVVPPPK